MGMVGIVVVSTEEVALRRDTGGGMAGAEKARVAIVVATPTNSFGVRMVCVVDAGVVVGSCPTVAFLQE